MSVQERATPSPDSQYFINPNGLVDKNPDRWAALFTRFNPLMVGVGIRRGLSFHDAQDNAQNTWIRIYRRITEKPFDFSDSPAGFITKSTVNGAIDTIRKSKRRREDLTDLTDVDWMQAFASSGEPSDIEMAYDANLQKALDELHPDLRLTFLLRVEMGLNEEETAEHLGISPGTVKSRVSRSREFLEKAIT